MTQKTKMAVHFFDFDGVIADSPEPETGKTKWAEHHGKDYPHQGWWSKPESLCLEAFDIQPFYKIDQKVREAIADPEVKTVLLTNRLMKLNKSVTAVLTKLGYQLDMLTFMHGPDNKGQRIVKILDAHFPEATEAIFYDDDVKHLRHAREVMEGHRVPIKLFKIERGEITPFN